MKKQLSILSILLAALLLLGGCAQSPSDVKGPSTSGAQEQQTPNVLSSYSVYIPPVWLSIGQNIRGILDDTDKVKLADSGEKVFDLMTKQTTSTPSSPAEREVTVAGKTYKVAHKESYTTALSQSRYEMHREMASMDCYRADGANDLFIEIVCDAETGLIRSFFGDAKRTAIGTMSEEALIAAAKEIVRSTYGEEIAAQYTACTVTEYDLQLQSGYRVKLDRPMQGYATNDSILVSLNRVGELTGIGAPGLGTLAPYRESVTKEQLDRAKDAFLASLNEGSTVAADPILRVGGDGELGELYMSINVLRRGGATTIEAGGEEVEVPDLVHTCYIQITG